MKRLSKKLIGLEIQVNIKSIFKMRDRKERLYIVCFKRPKRNAKREFVKGKKKSDKESWPTRNSCASRRSVRINTKLSRL